MPRPERSLDAQGDALAQFAAGLRALRDQAGRPGYRTLAVQAHYSATTLSDAAGGRILPTLAVTLAYVRACSGDVTEWEQRWHALAAHRTRQPPAPNPDQDEQDNPPYVGLAAFEPADAARFFGRETLIDKLVTRVQQRRLVTVFGASGAGKSSMLRAGLVARTEQSVNGQAPAPVILLTPGPRPVEECAVALANWTGQSPRALRAELLTDPDALHFQVRHAMADRPTNTDLLLVVDQFEEIFTQCHDQQERHAFITALVRATQQPTSQTRVVLGIRTDFYTHCTRVPELAEALSDGQLLVGPMNPEQLRNAITQPAIRVGCTVEGALLAAIIADSTGEPAVLPLLSHALLETWRRRRGNTLSLTGYRTAGGITHALTHTAEHTYEKLNTRQQRLAQALFLRLTALGEGTEDTKRHIHRDELDTTDPDTAVILDHLTQARLITLDHDRIELAHEALIRHWPRLRDWLAIDRDGLRIHRQLTDATHTWLALDCDPGALYRGSRLTTAQEWDSTTDAGLTSREREFLTASLTTQSCEQATTRRRTRRLRLLVALLSVLLLVATTTTLTAVREQQTANQQRDVALAQNALSQAATLWASDPDLARQLTLAAYQLAPTPQTSSGVLNAVAMPRTQRLAGSDNLPAISPNGRVVTTVADDRTARIWDLSRPDHPMIVGVIHGLVGPVSWGFSSDGRLLSIVDMGGAQLWDLTTPRYPHLLTTFAHAFGATVDVNDHLLATAGYTGVQLWDSTDLHRPTLLATLPTGQAGTAVFSAGGHALAVETITEWTIKIQLWDITNPQQPVQAKDFAGTIHQVSFSPTGAILAVATDTGASLWDITNPREPVQIKGFAVAGPIDQVTFTPTAAILAVATDTGATLWDITNPHQPNPIGSFAQADPIASIAWSIDGRTMATVSGYGVISLWNIDTPHRPQQVTTMTPANSGVIRIAFGPDRHTLVATTDQQVQLIDLPQVLLTGDTQGANDAAVSASGRILATIADPINSPSSIRAQIWDLTDLNQPTPTATLPTARAQNQTFTGGGPVFSPNGSILATASDHDQTQLWDPRDPWHPSQLATVPQSGSPAGFSPDGQILATVDDNGSGQLWDIRQPRHPQSLADLGVLDGPTSIAFDPRSPVLATIWGDQVIRLWDITNPRNPRMIASMPAGTAYDTTLTFDPTGHLLATSGNNRTSRLWNITDPRHPIPLAIQLGNTNDLNTIAFSPDGRTLATPGPGQTIQLWDLTVPGDPTLRATLTNAQRPLAFHPDGHTLTVIGSDNTIQLRETSLDQASTQLCALTTVTIAPSVWNQYLPGQPYQPPCR